MASIVQQLADAVVSTLRGVVWGGVPYVARRTYVDLQDEQLAIAGNDVDVAVLVPDGYDAVELDTRGSIERTATTTVVVRKRFATAEADDATGAIQDQQLDELVELAETLSQATIYERMADFDAAAIVPPVDHAVIYDRVHLRQFRQFTSVFRLTFTIQSEL